MELSKSSLPAGLRVRCIGVLILTVPLFAACSGGGADATVTPPSPAAAMSPDAPSTPEPTPAPAPSPAPAPTPPPPVAASGRAALAWNAPTLRTDGTPLTNLAGFRIYYGQHPDALTQRIEVTDPAATAASVENLASGTWYFAASAVDSEGQESYLSGTVSKTIT
jgi:hypothetical protein